MLKSINVKKNPVLAHLEHQLQNKNVSLKHDLLPTQYFLFNTLDIVRRNIACGSRDHVATSKANKEVFLETVLLAHWFYLL
jgi:hypothetical protein